MSEEPNIIELKGHKDYVNSVEFSPDGTEIVSASEDGTAVVWDVATKELVQKLYPKTYSLPVISAQFSPDGKKVVGVGNNSDVCIWKRKSHSHFFGPATYDKKFSLRRCILPKNIGIPERSIQHCVQFSPNGAQIVVAGTLFDSEEPFIHVLNPEEDTPDKILDKKLEGHTGKVVYSAQFSRDGTQIVSAGGDKTVRVWSVATGECVQTLEGHSGEVNDAQFSSDGTQIVSASGGRFGSSPGEIRIWSVATGGLAKTLVVDRKEGENQVRFFSAQFNLDGTKIVSACSDNSVRVWDVNTGVCENTFNNHGGEERILIKGTPGGVMGPGGLLGDDYDDDSDGLWAPSYGTPDEVVTHPNRVLHARFSPDGTKIVSGSSDHIVRMWDYKKSIGGSSIRRKTSKRKTSRRKTSRHKTSKRKTSKRMKLNRKKMNRKNRKLKNKTRRRRSR